MPRNPTKRGPGRPSLGVDARSVTRTIKLTPVAAKAQLDAAQREGLTWSAWATAAFELALARGSTR